MGCLHQTGLAVRPREPWKHTRTGGPGPGGSTSSTYYDNIAAMLANCFGQDRIISTQYCARWTTGRDYGCGYARVQWQACEGVSERAWMICSCHEHAA